MKISVEEGRLISRDEVFARTLRFLTSSQNPTVAQNNAFRVYNEECYLVCINVDLGKCIDFSSKNAVVPCSCSIPPFTPIHSPKASHNTNTGSGDSNSGCCEGHELICKLTQGLEPIVNIKDSGYFIRISSNAPGTQPRPAAEDMADSDTQATHLETPCGLYKRQSKCKSYEASSAAEGKNDSCRGRFRGAELVMAPEDHNFFVRPVEECLKFIYSELMPLSYYSTPSTDADSFSICHMTLFDNDSACTGDCGGSVERVADVSRPLGRSHNTEGASGVSIVWYKGEAKFFTSNKDCGPSGFYIQRILAGEDPREIGEFRHEVVRGVSPFHIKDTSLYPIKRWTFIDYAQQLHYRAKLLLERIHMSMACANECLSFRFFWVEHSFSLLCLVYLKQNEHTAANPEGSCIVCNLWQPSILTPNTIDLMFKNALISLSPYLERKVPVSTNDYYIYQGLPVCSAGEMGNLCALSADCDESGGFSPHNYSTRTPRLGPLSQPFWWWLYLERDARPTGTPNNSPNSRLQRYTGYRAGGGLAAPADVLDRSSACPPSIVNGLNRDGHCKVERPSEEHCIGDYGVKEEARASVGERDVSAITPRHGTLPLKPSEWHDGEFSSTTYASQSYDKSVSDVSTLSNMSDSQTPQAQQAVCATGAANVEHAGKCYCVACERFSIAVVPLLDKRGVIACGPADWKRATALLDAVFAPLSHLLDSTFFETKVEQSVVAETTTTVRSKARAGKTRVSGVKKLLGAASVATKALRDALKNCETLKQTIRRKLPLNSTRRPEGFNQVRGSIERVNTALTMALESVSETNRKLADTLSQTLNELEASAPAQEGAPMKRASVKGACDSEDNEGLMCEWSGDACRSDGPTDVECTLSPYITGNSYASAYDEPTFVSTSFDPSDVVFLWEEQQPPESRGKWMLYGAECGSPLTRSKAKKQMDRRSSPRNVKPLTPRALRRRAAEDFEEFDFETDFEEAKAKRIKKQPQGDFAAGQKSLVPMGPLPIGVYFDASRKLWRCQWRENGKFKTKGFSLSHYKTLADARHACILYRCEVGNMPVQPEWLNPVFVQVGSLAHKKVADKSE